MDALTALKTRRSLKPKELGSGPGPDADALQTILTIALRVPDHGKLCPWRLVVLQGAARDRLGVFAAEQWERLQGPLNEAQRTHEQQRFSRAPLLIAVLSTPQESVKAPRWEQELSAGAVCMNILQACHALGYGASWLSEWVAFDPVIVKALGGDIDSKIAGFIYIGEKTLEPDDRPRPDISAVVTFAPAC